jgi:hypothetical protein
MPLFRSNDEFFQAVRDLADRLRLRGHRAAAEDLAGGLACINGLTDGWALFLECVEKVEAGGSREVGSEERKALRRIRKAARAAVHRR